MRTMKTIKEIVAREILDSRGNPTVEVDVQLDGGVWGRASVPSGASTGVHEAVELRDKNKNRYGGKGVKQAVANITNIITPALLGKAYSQSTLDHTLISLDGTEQKEKLGANSILAVSMAFAHATAASEKIPLWQYFDSLSGDTDSLLPVPMMNILNGGKHAPGGVDIQEFMVLPYAETFSERLRIGTEIFHTLGHLLRQRKLSVLAGDEGGYAPSLESNEEALSLLTEAIQSAGFEPGKQVALAIDAASASFFENGKYHLSSEDKTL